MAQAEMALDLNQPAATLAGCFAASDEARAALGEGCTLAQALERLQDRQLWPDALHMLAQALPARVAVEWAWTCAGTIADQPEPARQALGRVRQWLAGGDEVLRLAAYGDAQALGTEQAAACVALAAFWSGGSMHGADLPEQLPAAGLCQHAAACAVQLAGAGLADKAADAYRQWIVLAADIAAGKRMY